MRTLVIPFISLVALPVVVWGQPPPPPAPPPAPSASIAASAVSPTISPSPSPESSLEQSIRNKQKHHFNFVVGKADVNSDDSSASKHGRHAGDDDLPAMVLPIVAVSLLTIFGAPVLIVAVILYFGFSKSRMQHRTIRMMVEKGQAVPAELLAPPAPAVRQRSDMRRGVVLTMIGLGLVIWLGAINDWEGGSWSLGLIPLLIGMGYLLVWKLEGGKAKPDNPPPLP